MQQQVKNITLMKDFMFYSPTEYVFGRGVEMKTGELAARHSGSRALVVYGGGSAVRSSCMVLAMASSQLTSGNCTTRFWSGAMPAARSASS